MKNMKVMFDTIMCLQKLYPEYASGLEPIKEAVRKPLDYFLEQEAVYRLNEAEIEASEAEIEQFAGMLSDRRDDIIDSEVVNNILCKFQKQRQTQQYYRYYSVKGPVAPEKIPENAVEVKNFNRKIFFDGINDEAWGYAEYASPLPEKLCEENGLVLRGMKPYWCVKKIEEHPSLQPGNLMAFISGKNFFLECPEPEYKYLEEQDLLITRNWFPSRITAEFNLRKTLEFQKERY